MNQIKKNIIGSHVVITREIFNTTTLSMRIKQFSIIFVLLSIAKKLKKTAIKKRKVTNRIGF